jgi:alpha-methylacyl-CoA racemase
MSGALAGLKIIEFAGIGPAPFACMLLADHGADVLRVERKGGAPAAFDIVARGRRSIGLDLKAPGDVETALALIERADALIEGFRPGVMEKLGLRPEAALARNPRLIYGRMTGWGQTGPLAETAGHDLNYLGLTGALHAMGETDRPPPPPLNLVADYGGGAMSLAFGVLAALIARTTTGRGQIVDAAMVDGTAALSTVFYGMRAVGLWGETRGANFLDGGAPFYACYTCADGAFVALGAIEPQFWRAFLDRAGLAADPDFAAQMDRSRWPAMKARLAALFRERPRDAWIAAMEGADACLTPVLSFAEAPNHPHMSARGVYFERDAAVQPGPAPLLSATPAQAGHAPQENAAFGRQALLDWGLDAAEAERICG